MVVAGAAGGKGEMVELTGLGHEQINANGEGKRGADPFRVHRIREPVAQRCPGAEGTRDEPPEHQRAEIWGVWGPKSCHFSVLSVPVLT